MNPVRIESNRLPLLLLIAIIGCAVAGRTSFQAFAETPNEPEEGDASVAVNAPEPVAEPHQRLTLEDALALALSRSPDLNVYSWDIRSADAKRLQSSLRPNPEFSVAVEDFLGTGVYSGGRQAQTTLRLSQLIELGGKRSARMDVAATFRRRAEADYHQKRVQVLSDVAEKFIHVVADQQELDLARDTVKLAADSLRAAERRVQAGKASAIEESKARVELSRSRVIEEHAEHELRAANRRLAATWGNTEPVFQTAVADLFVRKPIPPFETLAERVANSPEIVRWTTEERLREAEVRLADSKRVPDLEVQGGVRRLEGPREQGFVMQVSVPLPLFHRNQGDSADTRAIRDKTTAERAATEVRLRTVLYGLYQELQHSVTQLDILEREVLPEAKRSLALAREGFAQGKFSQIEMVDARRTFVEVRREFITAATAYHQNILEIERLTGLPLDESPTGGANPTPNSR